MVGNRHFPKLKDQFQRGAPGFSWAHSHVEIDFYKSVISSVLAALRISYFACFRAFLLHSFWQLKSAINTRNQDKNLDRSIPAILGWVWIGCVFPFI